MELVENPSPFSPSCPLGVLHSVCLEFSLIVHKLHLVITDMSVLFAGETSTQGSRKGKHSSLGPVVHCMSMITQEVISGFLKVYFVRQHFGARCLVLKSTRHSCATRLQ